MARLFPGAGHVSDGPIFSALPEKIGGEKGRWIRLMHAAVQVRQEPNFPVASFACSHLTGTWYAPPVGVGIKFVRKCL